MSQTVEGEKGSFWRDDVTVSVRGKGSVGRDVMLHTVQGGKWSLVRDVMLLTVQGESGRSGET